MVLILALSFLLFFILILTSIFIINFNTFFFRLKIFNLIFFGDLEIYFSKWNLLFLILVLIIRFSVLFFSLSYIHAIKVNNFVILYLCFVFRISWLILNNNFYWIILGWDGLGVVSFLLIIYYINNERINNGLFTLFQNRLGDLFFVLFLVGILNMSLNRNLILCWGIVFLIIGSAVKRAQYPFNAWLLRAIRAPTPISSLVHSSTLVVAGIFILLQYRYCLINFLFILKRLRLLTLLFRFWGLLNEMDIKKLIAFSTIRHVSLIIFLLSQKLFKVVYFHLNIHAIFKSLIFMAFGFLILSSFHTQDKRLISYSHLNPEILVIYYFSCFCLAGLPFLTGFFSKDFIIEKIIEFNKNLLDIVLLILFLGVSLYYSIKLLNLNKIIFSQIICEKQFISRFSLLIIIIINFLLVNLYIRLIFSISLEVSSFKFTIYFFIFVFLLVRLLSNLNLKLINYTSFLTIQDLKLLKVYDLDLYIYFSIFKRIEIFVSSINLKLFIIRNWWIIIVFIFIF